VPGVITLIELSIIIPTYNRLWALPRAIESCRKTRGTHEIIVIDDGSTDGTWDWLRRQSDVVGVRTDNWGKDWAVNKGFSLARGMYVRFLDSDDWLEADANDAQLTIARKTNADVVVAGYRTYNEMTAETVLAPWVVCDDFLAQQLGECQPSHYSAFILRRDFVKDIPHRQEFGANDDRMFILEVAAKNPRIAIHDGLALVHTHHAQPRLQVSTTPARTYDALHTELKIYEKFLPFLEQSGQLTQRRKRAPTKTRLWPLAHSLARFDILLGLRVARWVHLLDPGFVVPGEGVVNILYRTLGFLPTALLLAARREVAQALRSLRGLRIFANE
jgi:glycosyltransferase involved in cell wall biosynthesis